MSFGQFIGNKVPAIISLSIMGAVLGGIVAGITYQHLASFIMAMQVVVLIEVFRLKLHHKIIPFIFWIYSAIFFVFSFQWLTIVITGDTTFPSLWWAVHGLNCICIFYLVHQK